MRAHVIEDGIVVNTIEVESLDFLPGLIEAHEGGIGWHYDAATQALTPPPPPEPPAPAPITQISMRQCRLQLLADGHLATVNAAVPSMGEAAQIEWEYSATVDRGNPLVAALGQLLDLDAQALDAMFLAASQL